MAENTIVYSTVDDQLEKLKSQNLIISNYDYAKDCLTVYGYFNLIKSFRDPYITRSEGAVSYRSGVTFDQIASLYMLDKNLRNAVMAAMQDLEEHIKEATADVIANAFGTDQNDYLEFKNYQNRRVRKERFSLKSILNDFIKSLSSDKDPICHYRNEHGIVPPWILFKNSYFSTMVNFIHKLKKSEQLALIDQLYDRSSLPFSDQEMIVLMINTLFICLQYRNTSAHGGRIYNLTADRAEQVQELLGTSNSSVPKAFAILLPLLQLLKYRNPFIRLDITLNQEINRHFSQFPQDVTYISQVLGMDFKQTHYVYLSPASNKYHVDPHCSGMKNSAKIEWEDADAAGYIPCRRCVK